jgi:hypothetical protein
MVDGQAGTAAESRASLTLLRFPQMLSWLTETFAPHEVAVAL